MASIPEIYMKNSYDEYLQISLHAPCSVVIEGWCDQRFLTTNPPDNFETVRGFFERVILECPDLTVDLSKVAILDSRIFKILKQIVVSRRIAIVPPKKKFSAILNMYAAEFKEVGVEIEIL